MPKLWTTTLCSLTIKVTSPFFVFLFFYFIIYLKIKQKLLILSSIKIIHVLILFITPRLVAVFFFFASPFIVGRKRKDKKKLDTSFILSCGVIIPSVYPSKLVLLLFPFSFFFFSSSSCFHYPQTHKALPVVYFGIIRSIWVWYRSTQVPFFVVYTPVKPGMNKQRKNPFSLINSSFYFL